MSSVLYGLRKEIRSLLLQDNLWHAGEVIIRRRTDIWNDVAVAVAASAHGQCLVVGVAKGRLDSAAKKGSKQVLMKVTIPLTLIELPTVADEPAATGLDEDERWEATVLRLQAQPLGRSAVHYSLEFDTFEDVEDDQYVIRQTVFETTLLLKPA